MMENVIGTAVGMDEKFIDYGDDDWSSILKCLDDHDGYLEPEAIDHDAKWLEELDRGIVSERGCF